MHFLGIVPVVKMHPVGTIPKGKMHHVDPVPRFQMYPEGTASSLCLLFFEGTVPLEKITGTVPSKKKKTDL